MIGYKFHLCSIFHSRDRQCGKDSFSINKNCTSLNIRIQLSTVQLYIALRQTQRREPIINDQYKHSVGQRNVFGKKSVFKQWKMINKIEQ